MPKHLCNMRSLVFLKRPTLAQVKDLLLYHGNIGSFDMTKGADGIVVAPADREIDVRILIRQERPSDVEVVSIEGDSTRASRRIFDNVARAWGGQVYSFWDGDLTEAKPHDGKQLLVSYRRPWSYAYGDRHLDPDGSKATYGELRGAKVLFRPSGVAIGFEKVTGIQQALQLLRMDNNLVNVVYEPRDEDGVRLGDQLSINLGEENVATFNPVTGILHVFRRPDPAFAQRVENGDYRILETCDPRVAHLIADFDPTSGVAELLSLPESVVKSAAAHSRPRIGRP